MHTASPATSAPSTLGRVILDAPVRHRGVALRAGRADGGQETTFAQLRAAAVEIGAGLIGLGIRPGDRVGILGETRPEWTLADCGAFCAGATVVPVYHTNSPEECEYVLGHAEVRALICEDAGQLAKIEAIRERLPALEHVITMVPTDGAPSLADLRAGAGEGAEAAVEAAIDGIGPDDVATIVYTSGTTGPPKGCLLTHGNFLVTVRMYARVLSLGRGVVLFMFLPLAHALARVVELVALEVGAELAFWSRDSKLLLDDLAAARPTHFPSVPRVFEKVHTRAMATAEEGGALRRRIFGWALATGAAFRAVERTGGAGRALRARHAVADRLVLHKIRDLLGDRIQMGVTGAAPIGREVLDFFDACGLLVLEGYGMTETTAAATLNTPAAYRFGSVGRALPGTDVRIADDDEVLLSGPNVFAGYHRNQEATDEMIVDGWLHSGDLGRLDDGFLTITGRKKDLIITSSGKNITPANLESALRESRWVSEAIVIGDNRPYLVALIALDTDELPALAERAGVAPDAGAMASDARVRAELQRDVDAANTRFARIEQVKRFTVLERELGQAEGELTPTMKVKRAVVHERYAAEIAALYD